jgi:hypothetical protein
MPLSSEIETKVELVSVFVRVTFAPTTALPWGSVTVPRREARYWAWAAENERRKTKKRRTKR